MDIQAILIFQIIANVVLCGAILFLLLRIERTVNKANAPVTDEKSLLQFQQLLTESRDDADRFSRTLDESYRKFQELAISLEVREERLRSLVEEIKRRTETVEMTEHAGDEQACEKKYEPIMKFLEEGLPLEEIVERTGITSGEILLIDDLEKAKKRVTDQVNQELQGLQARRGTRKKRQKKET